MKSHHPTPSMRCAGLSALALLCLSVTQAAADMPATYANHFASHPMISGTIVSVNDHEMVVNTEQGEQVTLDVDSRTMAPRDMAPGMFMRADFVAQEDCHFYAQRIMAIRGSTAQTRPQAYANSHDTRASNEADAAMAGSYQRETGPQAAARHTPGVTVGATHSTADYIYSTRPMMSGRVVSANDHRLMVDTDQGQLVGLVMDSRTMVSSDVGVGTIVRTEFKPMKDGRHYATRVQAISYSVADREQAYARTQDSDFALAENTVDCGAANTPPGNSSASVVPAQTQAAPTTPPAIAQVASEPEPANGTASLLPQTASHQPLLLLLGMLGLIGGVVMMIVRRLRFA